MIQPIFTFLASEVPANVAREEGDARGQDTSMRIAYDDANESFCRPAVVKSALQELGILVRGLPPVSYEIGGASVNALAACRSC